MHSKFQIVYYYVIVGTLMNSKIIATIVIISVFAGFAALVGQISQQVSATSVGSCDSKGSSGQGAVICNFGDCKVIITPSDKINSNSKCR
jgi:hypothetical protein